MCPTRKPTTPALRGPLPRREAHLTRARAGADGRVDAIGQAQPEAALRRRPRVAVHHPPHDLALVELALRLRPPRLTHRPPQQRRRRQRRGSPSRSATTSPAGTSRPVTPSSTTWRQPRMSVVDDRQPARRRLHRRPRLTLPMRGEHEQIAATEQVGRRRHGARAAGRPAAVARRSRLGSRASGRSASAPPTTTRRIRRTRSRDGGEQLRVALLGDQPADGPDDHGVVVGPPRGPQRPARSRRGKRSGPEARDVDAVAEVAQLARRDQPEAADDVDVLDVLHQLERPTSASANASRRRRRRAVGPAGSSGVAYSPWTVLTTTGTPASRPTTRPYRPGFGLWVCSTVGRSRRSTRHSSAAARTSADGLQPRVDVGRAT